MATAERGYAMVVRRDIAVFTDVEKKSAWGYACCDRHRTQKEYRIWGNPIGYGEYSPPAEYTEPYLKLM